MNKIIALLVAMFAFIGAAQAAAPAAATHNWSGYYWGPNLGFAHQEWGISHYDDQTPNNGVHTPTANSFLGGLTFGRNWQNGDRVYGYEADLEYTGLFTNSDGGFSFDSCGCLDLSMRTFAAFRGRYGKVLGNGTLVYGTGGLMVGRFFYQPEDSAPDYGHQTKYAPGVIVGVGAEKSMFASNTTVKAELLYFDFGTPHFDTGDDGFGTGMRIWGIGPRVGLNWHF